MYYLEYQYLKQVFKAQRKKLTECLKASYPHFLIHN